MLVLTRKAGEGILIGDDIVVRIMECKDGRIRIGIEAPKDKKIYREEIYERICMENKEASKWDLQKIDALNAILPDGEETS
jgi:carbon storage regulator